jgi:hypothetical protein
MHRRRNRPLRPSDARERGRRRQSTGRPVLPAPHGRVTPGDGLPDASQGRTVVRQPAAPDGRHRRNWTDHPRPRQNRPSTVIHIHSRCERHHPTTDRTTPDPRDPGSDTLLHGQETAPRCRDTVTRSPRHRVTTRTGRDPDRPTRTVCCRRPRSRPPARCMATTRPACPQIALQPPDTTTTHPTRPHSHLSTTVPSSHSHASTPTSRFVPFCGPTHTSLDDPTDDTASPTTRRTQRPDDSPPVGYRSTVCSHRRQRSQYLRARKG